MKFSTHSSLRYLLTIASLLLTLLLPIEAVCQIDTVRNYFQNGNVHSEFPKKDGVTVGTVRYFYLDGSVKSVGTANDSGKMIHQQNFDKQGIKRSEYGTDLKGIFWRKNFNEKGDLVLELRKDSNSEETKIWYDNGILKSSEYYRDGFPVACLQYEKADTLMLGSEEICFCWNVRVKWQDSFYVSMTGEPVNLSYYWHKSTYFANGMKESVRTQEGRFLKIQEWDMHGQLQKDTITSIKAETLLIPYYEGKTSGIFEKEEEEGGPILKTKYPLRDTIVQRYYLKTINDTTIQISLWECYYDSLAQESWHGFDFTVYKIENTSLLPNKNIRVQNSYIYYGVDFQAEGIIVGINKTNSNEIIFHAMDKFWITSILYDVPIRLFEE